MRSLCQFSVRGGTTHVVSAVLLDALQEAVTDLGAEAYPLFLRMGGAPDFRLQPVQARMLLGEVERFSAALRMLLIPGIGLNDRDGAELGRMFRLREGQGLSQNEQLSLAATPEGIRIVASGFPPPVGFRSAAGLKPLHYECYFQELRFDGAAWQGIRTEEMGGGDRPVPLPNVPVPSVTRWDVARVAGKPAIASILYVETPAPEVFRDILHALTAACEESLRFRVPFVFHRD